MAAYQPVVWVCGTRWRRELLMHGTNMKIVAVYVLYLKKMAGIMEYLRLLPQCK
jgi:hypothetical protein